MSEVESCWPEQDAVDKWLTEEGINVSFETAMRLKDAVSKHRISVDKENADLRAQLDAANAPIQVREKASMGPRQYTEFVEAELAAANKRISELEEANSILSEELLTAEGALKLSAANYKQEEGVKKFVAALEQTKRITELEAIVKQLQRKFKDAVTENECLSASCKAVTKRTAELERKLAKQEAWRQSLLDMDNRGEPDSFIVDCLAIDPSDGSEELNKVITEAREEGRKDAVPDKAEMVDLINEHIGDAYFCTRVWSAWGVGTMSEDDFSLVSESGNPEELADAIIAMLAAAPSPASLNAQPSLTDRIRKHLSTGAHISASDFERILMEGGE